MKINKTTLVLAFLLASKFAQAQWTPTGNIYGGHMNNIEKGDDFYYSNTGKTVYRSSDLEAWSKLSESAMNDAGFFPFAIDFIYAKDDLLVINDYFTSIYSTNNGESYELLTKPLEYATLLALAKEESKLSALFNLYINEDSNLLYVYSTEDLGVSWSKTDSIYLVGDYVYGASDADNTNFLAYGSTKVIKFSDQLFSDISPLMLESEMIQGAAISKDGEVLLATFDYTTFETSLKLYNGTVWINSGTGISPTEFPMGVMYDDLKFYVNVLNIYDYSNSTYASEDGTSFTKMELSGMSELVITDIISSGGDTIEIASSKGIYSSLDNGETLSDHSVGIKDHYVTTMASNSTALFAAIDGLGLYRSLDNGETFENLNVGNVIEPRVYAKNNKLFLFSREYGLEVLMSSDNGASWSNVTGPEGVDLEDPNLLVELVNVANSNMLVSILEFDEVTLEFIYKYFMYTFSSDEWTEITSHATDNLEKVDNFFDVGSTLFIAGQDKESFENIVYKSSDAGISWVVESEIPSSIYSFKMSGTEQTLFLFDGDYGLYTFESGLWVSRANTNGLYYADNFIELHGNIYAVSSGQLFVTSDKGENWEMVPQDGSEEFDISCLTVLNNSMFAGTESSSMFKRDFLASVPNRIQELSVYPNPVVDVLYIHLPKKSSGRLELIDMKGSVVLQEAINGSNEMELSLHGIQRGLYLLNYTTGDNMYHTKILVK